MLFMTRYYHCKHTILILDDGCEGHNKYTSGTSNIMLNTLLKNCGLISIQPNLLVFRN